MCAYKCKFVSMCMYVCTRVSLLSSFGEQRSKVTAHKAALKVIRVIPALGSSCSFPLPRTHWISCTCTSDRVQYTVNSQLLVEIFFWPISCISPLSYLVARSGHTQTKCNYFKAKTTFTTVVFSKYKTYLKCDSFPSTWLTNRGFKYTKRVYIFAGCMQHNSYVKMCQTGQTWHLVKARQV